MSPSKTTGVAVGVLVLTFLAGLAAGVFTSHMMILHGGHGAGRFPHVLLNRLDRKLDLTDAQRAQVKKIIDRRQARIAADVRGEVERARNEIEQVLTPEQKEKYRRMRAGTAMR